jgi:hypothetical protein
VALIAEVEPVLAEMAERGVLPDLHVSLDSPSELLFHGTQPSEGPGREHLHLKSREGIAEVTAHLAAWLAERGWSEQVRSSSAERPLRVVDAGLLAGLTAEDTVRRTWVQRISHYQRADAGAVRVVWLAAAESPATD